LYRVVGGKEALSGEVPYQVGIFVSGFGIWCGGSIYSRDTVVSAAHCFYSDGVPVSSYTQFLVIAGKGDLSKSEDTEQLSTIASVAIHPSYSQATGVYDIAVIKLKVSFCFNSHVQPIPLLGPGVTPSGIYLRLFLYALRMRVRTWKSFMPGDIAFQGGLR
jgi:hypothetical protein